MLINDMNTLKEILQKSEDENWLFVPILKEALELWPPSNPYFENLHTVLVNYPSTMALAVTAKTTASLLKTLLAKKNYRSIKEKIFKEVRKEARNG